MSEHTKEPWRLGEFDRSQFGTDDQQVGECWDKNAEANTRRIVACVNACREMSMEDLKDDGVIKMKQDRDQLLKQIKTEKSLADELAAALDLCMGWIIFGEQGFPEQWDDAEKAIAKHREMRGK